MRYVLDHADARLVLVSPDWEERVRGLLGSSRARSMSLVLDPEAPTCRCTPASAPARHRSAGECPAPDALGLLMYTSGTTGRPKGVMLTQATSPPRPTPSASEHRLAARDRVLRVLPLYHINARS